MNERTDGFGGASKVSPMIPQTFDYLKDSQLLEGALRKGDIPGVLWPARRRIWTGPLSPRGGI